MDLLERPLSVALPFAVLLIGDTGDATIAVRQEFVDRVLELAVSLHCRERIVISFYHLPITTGQIAHMSIDTVDIIETQLGMSPRHEVYVSLQLHISLYIAVVN